MSNSFINAFNKKKNSKYHLEERVVSFSERLKTELAISDKLLEQMVVQSYSMDIGKIQPKGTREVGITLKASNRCFTDGWAHVIEAVPTFSIPPLGGWEEEGGGTGKAICPSDEYQDLILELVKTL